jgi:tetratricopeptide (TPR) repeat protein
MDIKKTIKSLLNQAEIYHSQGLLREARGKYVEAGRLIRKHAAHIANASQLLAALSKKLAGLKTEIQRVEEGPADREMSEQVQQIIKNKFVFGKEGDAADLEAAAALVKFGQFGRALEEFRPLLGREEVQVQAAQGMIRCYGALERLREAAEEFRNWMGTGLFAPADLEKLRGLLQELLDRRETGIALPDVSGAPETAESEAPPGAGEPPPDVTSVAIPLPDGSRTVEYDVSFQSGDIVNLLVPKTDRDFLAAAEPGAPLDGLQCFSPIAMFEGRGEVVAKTAIDGGPKAGDFSVDIRIQSL